MKPTGIVRDPLFLRHDMGVYHPESPRRLEVIYSMLEDSGRDLNLRDIPVRPASFEEIQANHSAGYVRQIAATSGRVCTVLDPDTSTCGDSWDAAAKAVGGLLNLIDAVVNGEVRNGFALVRPPGHHAEWDRAMGFCLFNNVAVAARYAMNRHGMKRIAIVDWDLHHGNGTQHSFYDDPRVLFISTHQYPYYPGTGSVKETGRAEGDGYTVNVPLSAGAGDREFVAVFEGVVRPVLASFQPELILLSAGFDAHRSDPLGGMGLTEDGYEQLIRILMEEAERSCDGRLVLTLEGGYDLQGLRDSVGRVLMNLATFSPSLDSTAEPIPLDSLHPRAARSLKEVVETHRKRWPDLSTV